MGRWWMVINLDKRQIGLRIGKLGEGTFDDREQTIARQLVIPFLKLAIPMEWLPEGAIRDKTSLGALSLPDELLRGIFAQMDAVEDLALMGVTDPRLALYALEWFRDQMHAHKGQWAGDRIAVVGDDVDNDFAANILTPEEVEEFTASGFDNLYELVDKTWPTVSTDDDFYKDAIHLVITKFRRRAWGSEAEDPQVLVFKLSWWPEETLPDYVDDPHALCNVSKGQFVRVDAVAELFGMKTSGPYLVGSDRWTDHWGIGNAIGILATWTTNDHYIECGPWAGDRLMITPIERMKAIDSGEDWQDFTEEGVRVVLRYCKKEYGDRWPE